MDLIRLIRKRCPEINAILMSSDYDILQAYYETFQLELDGVLVKPLSRSKLKIIIQRFFCPEPARDTGILGWGGQEERQVG
jgi:DNA-binding NarL/FixJ family response regulator